MFSVVLPGRLPLTNPQQVDETHCVFPLENAATISHVVVFMTGVQPFPPGYSATVHLLWPTTTNASAGPSSASGAEWKLLGCVRNTKPSAIFKVTPPAAANAAAATATLGISIETDASVDAQLATLHTQSSSNSSSSSGVGSVSFGLSNSNTGAGAEAAALSLAPKVAKNAFSYLSSFAPDSAPQTVPLLHKWLEQLERKLRAQGVGWLDKQE